MAKYYISKIDSTLCVAYRDNEYSIPTQHTHHWPISRIQGTDYTDLNNHIGQAVTPCPGPAESGLFEFRLAPGRWVTLKLIDGGKTQPIKSEKQELPPPKTKREIRYHNGNWQIYYKTKGWINFASK